MNDNQWAVSVVLALVGVGVATGTPFLVGLAVAPLSFVAAAGFDTAPKPAVELTREFVTAHETEVKTGDPGERITVNLTLRNTASYPLTDIRVIDGVPTDIPVVSGTPRGCYSLGPDETATIEYEIELRRGEHAFRDATVRSRGPSAVGQQTETKPVAGDAQLGCLAFVDNVPIDQGTNDFAGQIPTNDGGNGVEFYSVRDYEPGDSVRSIDWRRYANSRELATVEFRAERATRVVCLVDSRRSQQRAPSDDHLPALNLIVAAAERTFDAVIDNGYPTGVVSLNNRSHRFVEPGTDGQTRTTATSLLDAIREQTEDTEQHVQTRWGEPLTVIPSLLPSNAQVILFSSFIDDYPVDLVKQLREHGYPVCVVSPDIATGRKDTAGRLTAIQRRTRLTETRQTGSHVVDWDMGDPIGIVLNKVVSEVSHI
ncbi:DUF58 domain-containing protein [Halovenus rubra]|uniref:DUF58 domain-containing protein n=2 Tax=Halovenus rubra TaxID=869890 RepID=A0ACC7E710_9EURY|nr:DUF58 domain-containing protein [Halovenus rubra]